MNTGRFILAGVGIQTSALGFGGSTDPGNSAATESWNGSAWTSVNSLNTARVFLAGAGASNTSALAFGGTPPSTAATESWNGTSWTTVNSMNTARNALGGAGSQTAALGFGGNAPPYTGATELYGMELLGHLIQQDLQLQEEIWFSWKSIALALAFSGLTGTAVSI
jgi:hypothetical protein